MSAKPCVLEFGMGVDVHGRDSTKAACRAVSDAIRHSSLGFVRLFGKTPQDMVNNAGTSRAGPFEAMSDALLQEDLELKLFAAVRFCRLVIPQMKERKWGRIINVLNIGAKAPRAASAPTSVSRAAGMREFHSGQPRVKAKRISRPPRT